MSAREPPAGIRKVESSNDVEQSTMTALCRRADSTPSAPFSTTSTWGAPVTQRIGTSNVVATSAGVDADRTPRLKSSPTG